MFPNAALAGALTSPNDFCPILAPSPPDAPNPPPAPVPRFPIIAGAFSSVIAAPGARIAELAR